MLEDDLRYVMAEARSSLRLARSAPNLENGAAYIAHADACANLARSEALLRIAESLATLVDKRAERMEDDK